MTFSSRSLFIVSLVLAALVCQSTFKVAAVPVVMHANSSNPIDPREGGGFALPSKDDFYDVPKTIAAHANGQILRSRDVPTSLFGSTAAKVEQIAYKYTMTLKKPDMAVATLITPAGVATTGQFKLVVLSLPEDAAARDCAPSFAISNREYKREVFSERCRRRKMLTSCFLRSTHSWRVQVGRIPLASTDGTGASVSRLACSRPRPRGLSCE